MRSTATRALHAFTTQIRTLADRAPLRSLGSLEKGLKKDALSLSLDASTSKELLQPPLLNRTIKEAHSILSRHISESIRIGGPISTAQYMRQALTHPLGGYYMKQDVFGSKGDFITSPEISQMFGEIIGVWLVAQWQAMGKPAQFNIVELGPGRGTLMADVLRTVMQLDGFAGAIRSVNLVEASPFLRDVQANLLVGGAAPEPKAITENMNLHKADVPAEKSDSAGQQNIASEPSDEEKREGFPIHWHTDLDSVERGFPILLIAHEFFDAMPVYQFQLASDGWREIMIDQDTSMSSPHNFRFILSPGKTKASVTLLNDGRYNRFKEGSRIEVSPDSYTYAHKIGERIKTDGGFALIADYGKDVIMSDTLRGIQNHKFVSALSKPGDSDLTADVDFTFLRKAFLETGTKPCETMTQGDFLRSMGMGQRLQVLLKMADADKRKDLAQAFDRLVGPSGVNGMGEIYKFMAVTRETDPTPYPFIEKPVEEKKAQ
ncbi:NADH dehydrogenase [ubiquinone] complex I, assembly factor 7 [Chytriomyces hyalinus]|nr:NADH dehydrogenase [ubiquinone] complex I, assembly factor 7 [Chytriomyces hyalinus]